MKKTLTIVSRKSPLALCQANLVKTQLAAHHPALEINIVGIQSAGDRFLDQPLAFPEDQLLTLALSHLLAVSLESIPESSSLYGLGGLPQPIIQACDYPRVFSPCDQLPPQHAPIEYVSEAFHLEALLAELAPSEPVLLSVTRLEVILQFLVVIHQVLGDPEQVHHPLAVGALSPLGEGNG